MSYDIKTLKMKKILRYLYVPIRIVKIQNTDKPNAGEDAEQRKLSAAEVA